MIYTMLQYDDGSGPRLALATGHPLEGGEKTVRITGIGDATVQVADIEHLICGLRAAQRHFEREENDA